MTRFWIGLLGEFPCYGIVFGGGATQNNPFSRLPKSLIGNVSGDGSCDNAMAAVLA